MKADSRGERTRLPQVNHRLGLQALKILKKKCGCLYSPHIPLKLTDDTYTTVRRRLAEEWDQSLTWLYIFILAGKSMTDDPGPAGIGLFIGAFVMYLGQVIALLQMRKNKQVNPPSSNE